jgi:hypothetical protein
MKKIIMLFVALLLTVSANAQFEKDKIYVGASLSGLDLSYNGKNDLSLGVQGKLGYMIEDNWLIFAEAGYQHVGDDDVADEVHAGVGGRYYIIQNGLFLGANAKLLHASHNYNDVMPGVEVGYAFFLSRTVTIEPSIYYQQSFRNHSDYSTIGLKVGVGIYL